MLTLLAILDALTAIASALWGIAKISAVMAILVAAVEILFDPKGKERVGQFVANLVRGALGIATPLLNEVQADLSPIVVAFADSIAQNGKGIRDLLKTDLGGFAKAALTAAQTSLEGKTDISPADWASIAGDAMADAAAFGLGSFAVSAAFEAAFPEKLNTLNSLGPMLATLSGFEEVTSAALRPLFFAGIAQPSRYDANSRFRSLLPDLRTAQILYSRRKISAEQFSQLLAFAGLSKGYVNAAEQGSFRALQPRALATLVQDTPFDRDAMRAVLEDNGYRDQDVNLLLDLMEYNSTKNVRNTYISKALTAYGHGVVGDTELDEIMTEVGWSPEARQLAKNGALIARREELAREVEAQVTGLVTSGLMSPDVGLQQLEAAGVVDWQANLKITLATTKAELQQARKAATAETRQEITRQRNLTRAAVAEFERGVIDAVGLTAALVALGLDPTLVASIVAVETAKQSGRLKFVYGQLLTPQDAKVLSDKVAAFEAQYKKQLIDDAAVTAALADLKVPAPEARALIARWAAMKTKPTTTGERLPV